MKKQLLCLLIVGILFCGIGMSGCTTGPFGGRTGFLSTEMAFYATCEILLLYYEQGYIPETDWLKVKVWIDVADVALDAWHRALIVGDDPSAPYAEFHAMFQSLIEAQLKAERRKNSDN